MGVVIRDSACSTLPAVFGRGLFDLWRFIRSRFFHTLLVQVIVLGLLSGGFGLFLVIFGQQREYNHEQWLVRRSVLHDISERVRALSARQWLVSSARTALYKQN